MRTLRLFGMVSAGILSFVSAASGQDVPAIFGGMDTVNRGFSQAGARDCEKAKAEQDAHFQANMDNPQAAVFGGAKKGCSYLEEIAWKAPTAKSIPKAAVAKGAPGAAEVADRAAAFWAGSDDMHHVKVLKGGVLGSWDVRELSDLPGVPHSRWIGVYHLMIANLAGSTTGCFVVYGHLAQENTSYPDDKKPPAWSASTYKASDSKRAEKVACPKGATPPKPATP